MVHHWVHDEEALFPDACIVCESGERQRYSLRTQPGPSSANLSCCLERERLQPPIFLDVQAGSTNLDEQRRQLISWSLPPTWLSNFATVNGTANFSRKGITSDFFPVMLDLPLPLSFATRSVRAIPCTRAVLFLLSFPKECFASHVEPILHDLESMNIKQTKNSSNIGRFLEDTSSVRHWIVRGEDLQSYSVGLLFLREVSLLTLCCASTKKPDLECCGLKL